jgi:catechol 2,3-dioxygenase-like lactoylglutathione lyase family enzyme
MLDHVTLSITDLARAQAFYDPVLAAIGIARLYAEGTAFAGYGVGEKAFFWIGVKPPPITGAHIAFTVPDRATVARFHVAALAAGGRDNGAPGLRPHYHPDYYGAFVLDPDGHNIEAVCHREKKAVLF